MTAFPVIAEDTMRSTTRRTTTIAALLLTLAATPAGVAAAHTSPSSRMESVLVTGQPGALSAVRDAVTKAGGHITRDLPVIDGVSARMPVSGVAEVRSTVGVRSVTADAQGHLMGIDPTLGYDPVKDDGSLSDIERITQTAQAWKQSTGAGVDVALIDSGVAPVEGLTSGNVINGPDLSFESQDPDLAHLDTFGHGTHMASIIAGRDSVGTAASYQDPKNRQFDGIAPDARLISVKVASADGAADVSQVIAAIDWVTEHAHSGGLNIKVLNLSYGTNSTQSPAIDPLDYAVENAWKAGITVVVSAGNDGTNRQELADPADDPLVIAVGADDPNNTDPIGDDTVPAFSQRGTSTRGVDIIEPGVHVLGLRDPGSYIDQNNPSAVVGGRFFRGSGTSQAAAVASGEAALYMSKYPSATPDQVKYALMNSAVMPSSVRKLYAGLGVPNMAQAIGNAPGSHHGPGTGDATQSATGATGTGSLEAARGTAHISSEGVALSGETDIFGQTWNPATWAAASASGTAWDANGDFNGHQWAGVDWSGNSWAAQTWSGHQWADNDWQGHQWADSDWAGHQWADNGWDGHQWADNGWDGHQWADSDWAGSSWADSSWS
jgi:serine protease AprX